MYSPPLPVPRMPSLFPGDKHRDKPHWCPSFQKYPCLKCKCWPAICAILHVASLYSPVYIGDTHRQTQSCLSLLATVEYHSAGTYENLRHRFPRSQWVPILCSYHAEVTKSACTSFHTHRNICWISSWKYPSQVKGYRHLQCDKNCQAAIQSVISVAPTSSVGGSLATEERPLTSHC